MTNHDITGGNFEDGYWVCQPVAQLDTSIKTAYYLTKTLRYLEELALLGGL